MGAEKKRGRQMRLAILKFVESFVERNGYAPALREVTAGVGLASWSSISHHLQLMRADGLVSWEEGKVRTLAVTPRGSAVLVMARADEGRP
jgi:repressor LexA